MGRRNPEVSQDSLWESGDSRRIGQILNCQNSKDRIDPGRSGPGRPCPAGRLRNLEVLTKQWFLSGSWRFPVFLEVPQELAESPMNPLGNLKESPGNLLKTS